VFSQFLLSDGTPLITSKSVCQQPVSRPMRKPWIGLVLWLGLAGTAAAEDYRLQVANLYRDSFVQYFDGPLGTGSG